jgi:hypothetical protein
MWALAVNGALSCLQGALPELKALASRPFLKEVLLRPYSWVALLFSGVAALFVLAACGGSSSGTVPTSTTASPASVSFATSAPLSSSALSQQALATAVPAPTGYAQSISAALVTAAANTSITIKEGSSNPSGIPALGYAVSNGKVGTMGKVRPLVSGQNNAVFYDVIIPSASITVAGTVTFTQSFPSGVLASGTNYYLAFYDSTQASPSWQTISGPVTESNNTLTFSGTIGSFTLQQGDAYGFCVFAESGSSTPPPSTNQDAAYLAQGTGGIVIVNTAGTTVNTLAINSNSVALDDSANIYNDYFATPAPSATTPPPTIQKYNAGSTTPSTTYVSQMPVGQSGIDEFIVESSGAGEVVNFYVNYNTSPGTLYAEVWNPGSSGGAPNYTLSSQFVDTPAFDVQHDGTIYLANNNGSTQTYGVYPPGSTTPSRTVAETIVTGANLSNFAPNYMTVGPDGTIYVTEFGYYSCDTLAGLYIYPPSGTETFVATASDANGAGPQGVDVDATGNIYVGNNNAGYNCNSGMEQNDDLNNIQVFAPGGSSVSRTVTGSFDVYPLVVAPDGTIFFGSFQGAGNTGVNGTFVVAPGATAATSVSSQGETSIVLYNGYQESAASTRRKTSSFSAGAAAAHSGHAAFARFMQRMHKTVP